MADSEYRGRDGSQCADDSKDQKRDIHDSSVAFVNLV